MQGIIPGGFYNVAGTSESTSKYVVMQECMYVRKEDIKDKKWYAFLYAHEEEFLNRVRIPCENAKITGNMAESANEVVIKAILMQDTHLTVGGHSPLVNDFLNEAIRLCSENTSANPKKAKLVELLQQAMV
jgi:hypothetical protein